MPLGEPGCAGAPRPVRPASARRGLRSVHSIAAVPPSPNWAGPHSPTGTATLNAEQERHSDRGVKVGGVDVVQLAFAEVFSHRSQRTSRGHSHSSTLYERSRFLFAQRISTVRSRATTTTSTCAFTPTQYTKAHKEPPRAPSNPSRNTSTGPSSATLPVNAPYLRPDEDGAVEGDHDGVNLGLRRSY